MMKTALRFYPGGRVVAIHDDSFPFQEAFGPGFAAARRRASLINTVEEGPHAGRFYADMTLLAERTGDPRHQVCLWPPRPTETECKADEFEYVRRHLIDGAGGRDGNNGPDADGAPVARTEAGDQRRENDAHGHRT